MENLKLYNQINHRINRSSYRVSASAFNKKFSFSNVMVNLMLDNEELVRITLFTTICVKFIWRIIIYSNCRHLSKKLMKRLYEVLREHLMIKHICL